MNVNQKANSNNTLYKNVQFWIADVLELYKEPLSSNIKPCYKSIKVNQSNDLSIIKTLTVVGVVVGVRNERSETFASEDLKSTVEQEYNRPIVYGT